MCYNCRHEGHFNRECSELKKVHFDFKSSIVYLTSHAMVAYSLPLWTVDLSTTKHITRDRAGYVEYCRILVGCRDVEVGEQS